MRGGVAREMGLGGLTKVSLANARAKADAQRKLLSDGVDPLVEKAARQKEGRLVAAETRTFEQCAESYIEAQSTNWRNAKHAAQWTSTLRTYVYSVFGDLYRVPKSVTLGRLNEAAVAALKLLQEWACQRHPRRCPAHLQRIDRCSRINDDGDQQDLDTCKRR
jgi:hypothetical protein